MSLSDNDYELLSAYIDNQLTEAERATLETRLSQEPALQAELDALRSVSLLVGHLPTLKAPRDFSLTAEMLAETPAQALPDNVEELTIPVSSLRKSPLRMFAAVAAVTVAVLYLFMLIQSEIEPPPLTVALQPSATPALERIMQATQTDAGFDIVQGAESNATVLIPETPTLTFDPAGASDAALLSVAPPENAAEGAGADTAFEFAEDEGSADIPAEALKTATQEIMLDTFADEDADEDADESAGNALEMQAADSAFEFESVEESATMPDLMDDRDSATEAQESALTQAMPTQTDTDDSLPDGVILMLFQVLSLVLSALWLLLVGRI